MGGTKAPGAHIGLVPDWAANRALASPRPARPAKPSLRDISRGQRPELARSAPRAEENRVREVIRSGVEGEVRTPAAAPPGGVAVGHGAALGAHQPPTGRASRSGTVVDALAARDGLVFAIAARRARREVLRRADVELVAAVGAAVRAGRDVAPCWNWVRHVGDVPDAPAVKRRDVGSGP